MITDTRDITKAMKLSSLQWVDLSFNSDNPYDQERICEDVRQVFYEKRQYWKLVLSLCALYDVPALCRRTELRNKQRKAKCHLLILPKDLIRHLASLLYPWPIIADKTNKT